MAMNGDIEQLRTQLYADANDERAASARVHRQLTDAWLLNNQQLLQLQAATKRQLTYASGMKQLKARLATLRTQHANIANQLHNDTTQAAAMVSLRSAQRGGWECPHHIVDSVVVNGFTSSPYNCLMLLCCASVCLNCCSACW